MAGLYGHVGEYVEGEEEWSQYTERVEHFFAANGVTDDKVSVFLAIVGPKEYKLLSSLLAPVKPGEKSYAELFKF